MIFLVVAAMALLGGTTWLAQEQSITRNPVRNSHLTAVGMVLCLLTVVAALIAAAVTFSVTG